MITLIKTEKDIAPLVKILIMRLKKGKDLEVSVKNYVEDIKDDQRKLWWCWITELANYLGYEKNELHYEMKKLFLPAIYVRDDINNYSEVAENLNTLKGHSQHGFWRGEAMKRLSIMDLNKKQMAELLTSLQVWAAHECNFNLSTPEREGLLQ